MTDEELTNLVFKTIKDEIEKSELPEFVTVKEDTDGIISFHLHFSSLEIGEMNTYYYLPLERLKELVTPSKYGIEKLGYELAQEFSLVLTRTYIKDCLNVFHLEFENTFTHLLDLPNLLLQRAYKAKCAEDLQKNNEITSQFIKSRTKATHELLKKIYKDVVDQSFSPKRMKNVIAHFYDLQLPKWREAKTFYEKNKNYEKWREMLDLAIDEVFPKDLIEQFVSSDPYESMPSTIALEQAARMCGFPADSLSIRTKQKYLKESRKWIGENGEEAKEILVVEYLSQTQATLDFQLHAQDVISGQNGSMRFLHYIQEWLWLNHFKKEGVSIEELLWKDNESNENNAQL